MFVSKKELTTELKERTYALLGDDSLYKWSVSTIFMVLYISMEYFVK